MAQSRRVVSNPYEYELRPPFLHPTARPDHLFLSCTDRPENHRGPTGQGQGVYMFTNHHALRITCTALSPTTVSVTAMIALTYTLYSALVTAPAKYGLRVMCCTAR